MILRYFYINDYYEKRENLNINLGGKFRFWYQNEKIYVDKNEDYARSLYEGIPEISDISAILGKNGAGKTSVLRMINFLFNDLQRHADGKYIIIFELPDETYVIYSKLNIRNISEIKGLLNITRVDKEEIQKRFKDIGLVYYSGIFDKTTPFQENANLKDISINSEFEKFCRKKFFNDMEENIVNRFRADNIKREVKFHIMYNKEFEKAGLQLLFEIPRKIEVGYVWALAYIEMGENSVDIREQLQRLKGIDEKLSDYILKNNNVNSFLREFLLALLLDEIVKNIEANKYNFNGALIKLQEKVIQNKWNIEDYFQDIINELFITDLGENIDHEDSNEGEIITFAYEDVWDEVRELIDDFQSLEKIDVKKAHKIIGLISEFVISDGNDN